MNSIVTGLVISLILNIVCLHLLRNMVREIRALNSNDAALTKAIRSSNNIVSVLHEQVEGHNDELAEISTTIGQLKTPKRRTVRRQAA